MKQSRRAGGRRLSRALALAITTAFSGLATDAAADDCAGASLVMKTSEEAAARVDVRSSEHGWQARVLPAHLMKGPYRTLEGVPKHGHLIVAGPTADGRFLVIRGGAGREAQRRVLLYRGAPQPQPSAAPQSQPPLRPLRAWDLKDILTPEELKRVRTSVSHIDWLAQGAHADRVKYDPEKQSVTLEVLGGRAVTLPLREKATPSKAP